MKTKIIHLELHVAMKEVILYLKLNAYYEISKQNKMQEFLVMQLSTYSIIKSYLFSKTS